MNLDDYVDSYMFNDTSILMKEVSKVRTLFAKNGFYNEYTVKEFADQLKAKYPNTRLVFSESDGEIYIHFYDEDVPYDFTEVSNLVDKAYVAMCDQCYHNVCRALGRSYSVDKFYACLHKTQGWFYSLMHLQNRSYLMKL